MEIFKSLSTQPEYWYQVLPTRPYSRLIIPKGIEKIKIKVLGKNKTIKELLTIK